MWPKFGNSSIFMKKVIITNIFVECSWFKFNNLGLTVGMDLKFYTSVAKGLKLKEIKVFGGDSNVCRSYREKTGSGPFCSPILNRINGISFRFGPATQALTSVIWYLIETIWQSFSSDHLKHFVASIIAQKFSTEKRNSHLWLFSGFLSSIIFSFIILFFIFVYHYYHYFL